MGEHPATEQGQALVYRLIVAASGGGGDVVGHAQLPRRALRDPLDVGVRAEPTCPLAKALRAGPSVERERVDIAVLVQPGADVHLSVQRDVVAGGVEPIDEGRRRFLGAGELHAGRVAEGGGAVAIRDGGVAVYAGDADEVVIDLNLVGAQPHH